MSEAHPTHVLVVGATGSVRRRCPGGFRDLLTGKRRSERLVRASGLPYTVVRDLERLRT